MIQLELLDKGERIIRGKIDHEKPESDFRATGEQLCVLGIKDYSYQNGDKIKVTVTEPFAYYVVQLDESLGPSLLYFSQKEWIYELPLADHLRKSGGDTAFSSRRHHLMVRKAYDFEIENEQNLSFNSHDQKADSGVYPHALANVETREEAVFFAKNAIDGKYANQSHGSYPFTSWGINQQEDAALTIDFGREVEVHRVALLLRCDFPHDSYWKSAQLSFSNGQTVTVKTEKSTGFQSFDFPEQITRFVRLDTLKKAEDTSPFPALTQIEVFGKNITTERGKQ